MAIRHTDGQLCPYPQAHHTDPPEALMEQLKAENKRLRAALEQIVHGENTTSLDYAIYLAREALGR